MIRHTRTSGDVFLGADVGTQGVRVVALDEIGQLVAEARVPFAGQRNSEQQDAEIWWLAFWNCLQSVAAALRNSPDRHRPVSLSVAGTSGTIVPLDDRYQPVFDALLYSDTRAEKELDEIQSLAPELGCSISWSIPKMWWFKRTHPELTSRVAGWRHVTDFIIGRLTGQWQVTDEASALKSGYDLSARRWQSVLWTRLSISAALMPDVVPAGTPVGKVQPAVCDQIGLLKDVVVTTGMTDGCASQIASGAVRAGNWGTTLGTTMVVKGVTRDKLLDPRSHIYHHRHPDGLWMPGGASNTGADWVSSDYGDQDLEELSRTAAELTPTGAVSYPLRLRGERFPFVSRNARGFDPSGLSDETRFAARLEGVAYLERLAYELLERLSNQHVGTIYSAGGASRSDVWVEIRSTVLQRPIIRTRYPEGAVGAAVIGASRTVFSSLIEAAERLVQPAQTTYPRHDGSVARYDEAYAAFCDELRNRGYLDQETTR